MVKSFMRQSVKIGREREKVVALKQESISAYCKHLHASMAVYSLRTQIHRHVKSLRRALDKVPSIRWVEDKFNKN